LDCLLLIDCLLVEAMATTPTIESKAPAATPIQSNGVHVLLVNLKIKAGNTQQVSTRSFINNIHMNMINGMLCMVWYGYG
jgi:hypothetical protein